MVHDVREGRGPGSLHVVLVTVGTRGDVQPFVALGQRLTREGHRVTVATHDEYASFVGGHGLGFRPMGGSFKPIVESDLGRQWIESGDSFRRFLDLSRRVFEPLYATWARDAPDAVFDADLVLFHALTRGAVDAAEKRGVPATRRTEWATRSRRSARSWGGRASR